MKKSDVHDIIERVNDMKAKDEIKALIKPKKFMISGLTANEITTAENIIKRANKIQLNYLVQVLVKRGKEVINQERSER